MGSLVIMAVIRSAVVVVVGAATGNRNGSVLNVSIECIPLMVFKFERFFEMSAIVFSFGSC